MTPKQELENMRAELAALQRLVRALVNRVWELERKEQSEPD